MFALDHPCRVYISKKLVLLHNFRWTFLFFLVVPILFGFFDYTVLSWQQSWVSIIVNQVLFLMIFIHICVTLRPQPFSYYFIRFHERPQEPEQPVEIEMQEMQQQRPQE